MKMKDVKNTINYNGNDYDLVFNLNVMEQIQDEYGTLDNWGELTDGVKGEVNVKAMKFGLLCMINEGIDMKNEKEGTDIKPFTSKQIGRILTEVGVKEMTEKVNDTVIESTKSDEKNA